MDFRRRRVTAPPAGVQCRGPLRHRLRRILPTAARPASLVLCVARVD
jgi:hypothetical protein